MIRALAFVPHTVEGSPGSTTRIRELYKKLPEHGLNVETYSPFEKLHTTWKTIPAARSPPRLSTESSFLRETFGLSKRFYYSRFLPRFVSNRPVYTIARKVFSWRFEKFVRRTPTADLLIAEHDVSIGPCLMAGRKHRLPVVVDLHNCAPDELVGSGCVKQGSREHKAMATWLKEQLSQVDGVAVVSQEMLRHVHDFYDVPASKMVIVPPGGKIFHDQFIRRPAPKSIVYSGMVAYREHVDLFVESMPLVSRKIKNAKFHITRKGDMFRSISKLTRSLSVAVEFFWYNEEQFYPFLGTCHVGVLPSSQDQARKMGTPVKLLDYMSVGLPVVANYIGGWSDMIRKYDIGLTTEDTPKDFAENVIWLIDHEDHAKRLGDNAMKIVQRELNWTNSAKEFCGLVNNVISKH